MAKITRKEACNIAETELQLDLAEDGLTFPISTLVDLRELSKRTNYRHPDDANCSRGLGFWYWLQQQKYPVYIIMGRINTGAFRFSKEEMTVDLTYKEHKENLKAYQDARDGNAYWGRKKWMTKYQIKHME